MKRGKRQIIEKPIDFQNQDNNNTTFSLFSSSQNQGNKQCEMNASSDKHKDTWIQKTKEISNNSESINKEQQKKKRLQLLKQRYLQKPTNFSSQKKEDIIEQSKPVKQIQAPNHKQRDRYISSPNKEVQLNPIPIQYKQNNIQKPYNQTYEKEQAKVQKESYINQQTEYKQQSVNQINNYQQISTVVPPPKRVPSKVARNKAPIMIPTISPTKEPIKQIIKQMEDPKTLYSHSDPLIQQQSKLEELGDTEHFQEVKAYSIEEWLQCPTNFVQDLDLYSQVKAQLKNLDSFLAGFLSSFVFTNQIQMNLQQKQFIFQTVQKLQAEYPQKKVLKLICLIKCGKQYYNKKIQSQIMNHFAKIKSSYFQSILNPTEVSDLISYFINTQLKNQIWPLIIALIEFVSRFEKQSAGKNYQPNSILQNFINLTYTQNKPTLNECIHGLIAIKRNDIIERNCNTYFMFINCLVGHLKNQTGGQQKLERIIKQINLITLPKAYELKKQIKRKIIRALDTSAPHHVQKVKSVENSQSNLIQSSTMERSISDSRNENRVQGIGKNFMGFLNHAYKKIKSQAPQQKQTETEKIEYDPVNKIYLCNGKPMQAAQQPAKQIQQKKKPPPPPSKYIKKNLPQKISENPDHTQEVSQNNNVPENYSQDKQKPKLPPPPPRVGLKGMNAKPRNLARYA